MNPGIIFGEISKGIPKETFAIIFGEISGKIIFERSYRISQKYYSISDGFIYSLKIFSRASGRTFDSLMKGY